MAKVERQSKNWADVTVAVASAAMNMVSVFNQLRGIGDILSDHTLNGWEKFGAILTTVAGTTMTLMQAMTALKTITDAITNAKKKKALAAAIEAQAEKMNNEEGKKSVIKNKENFEKAKSSINEIRVRQQEKKESKLLKDKVKKDSNNTSSSIIKLLESIDNN